MAITNELVEKVWQKGTSVAGNDPKDWRRDQCGAWIGRAQYGNRNSQYGWEVDHIKPVSEGGSDDLSNLRPLQWENNAAKQSGRLVCVAVANGINNTRRPAV